MTAVLRPTTTDRATTAGSRSFPLVALSFLGLCIAVFLLVGRRWPRSDRRSRDSVLAERYARGEIDELEYRRRHSVLRGKA